MWTGAQKQAPIVLHFIVFLEFKTETNMCLPSLTDFLCQTSVLTEEKNKQIRDPTYLKSTSNKEQVMWSKKKTETYDVSRCDSKSSWLFILVIINIHQIINVNNVNTLPYITS